MALQLKQVFPTYFEEERKNSSEIWGKDLIWSKGALIKIVAPSGSGKTSLMSFLYGMRKDYTGSIQLDDTAIGSINPEGMASIRQDRFSIVFQDLRLFADQTAFQNINIKRLLNPFHEEDRIYEMAEKLGIGNKMNSLAKTCSYGEQQRIAIIRALMQPFDYLLLDEPFSHLDTANSKKAMELMLQEAEKRSAAIIFADLERIDYFPYEQLYHL